MTKFYPRNQEVIARKSPDKVVGNEPSNKAGVDSFRFIDSPQENIEAEAGWKEAEDKQVASAEEVDLTEELALVETEKVSHRSALVKILNYYDSASTEQVEVIENMMC